MEVAHGRSGQHLSEKQGGKPASSLSHHLEERRFQIGRVQGFHAAHLLDVFGRFFLGDIEDVVARHYAQQDPVGVHHGEGDPVVLFHHADGYLTVVRCAQGEEIVVHQRRHRRPRVREQYLSQPEVVDELSSIVHDIDHVDGFRIPAVLAYVIEGLLDSPAFANRHIVGSHQAADALFPISEKRASLFQVFGAQEREKTLRYLRRQLFQERSPVVGSQARNDLARVFVGQIAHQLVLFRNLEIREDLVRLRPGQRPKNQHPLRGIQRLNLVGQLRGQETGEPFLQFRPATLLDQLLDFLLRDCGRHHSIPSFRKNIRGTLQGRDACPPPAIDD